MATQPQIDANRRNAQHSTGPVTDAGKANSSRNHLTLGLYTRTDYVKPEERDYYKEFCETMYHELTPVSLLEECLVSEITGASWRLRRCSAAEAELGDFDDATDKTRRSIERARASAHSLMHRSINQLRKLQKDLANQEKRNLRAEKQAEKAETDAMTDSLDLTLASIMNCPEPDWDAIDLDIARDRAAAASGSAASNCSQGHAVEAALTNQPEILKSVASNCEAARPYRHEDDNEDATSASVASNCKPTQTDALIAALTKRNLPCACKSGLIYRNCCGINEPRDWRKAA